MERKEERKKDRKMLTLFFIMAFSLLIAMTRAIDNFIVATFFQVVLIFVQFIFMKSIIDSYLPD